MGEFWQIVLPEKAIIPVKGYWDGTGSGMKGPGVLLVNRGKRLLVERDLKGSFSNADMEGWLDPANFGQGLGQLITGYENKYLLPGLVDCHVHLALDGIDFQQAAAQWQNRSSWEEEVKGRLAAAGKQGVTLVRDGGDAAHIGLQANGLRAKWQEDVLPDIVPVGEALRRADCYGSFLGPGLVGQGEGDLAGIFRRKIGRLKGLGAQQLKVLVSGIVSFAVFGKVGKLQFTLPELQLLVNLAHEEELKVMAHVNSPEGIAIAIQAGVDSIEHGYFITEKQLEGMAEKGIAWIPTVVPVANQVRLFSRRYSQEEQQVITKTYRRHLAMIKKAAEIGVKLGVGTDAGAVGVTHEAGYLQELWLYQEAGLDNLTILKAAVCWGREILGRSTLGEISGANSSIPARSEPLLALGQNPFDHLDKLISA